MSAQAAPAVIDSLEFARTGQILGGHLPIVSLARLRDSLFDRVGEVRFEARGGHDKRQRPLLALEISGVLHLQCQRCLGRLDYVLQLSSTLLLVSGGEMKSSELDDGDADWVAASVELDLAELVEEELLLSLPYAPKHDEGFCPQYEKAAAGGATAFSKLAALKRNSN